MPTTLAVAIGGAAGATARYGLDRLIERRTVALFPWSTFTINVTGCFVIGALVAALVDRQHAPAWLRVGLVVGVVGGYTTFSTFAQETVDLLDGRAFGVAFAYAVGSVAAGVAAVMLGAAVGRSI